GPARPARPARPGMRLRMRHPPGFPDRCQEWSAVDAGCAYETSPAGHSESLGPRRRSRAGEAGPVAARFGAASDGA
ncbi:hypothetical protein, partial [Actinoplanes rectilineatus]|uniref:hypothetical protein n=1 Tax=Actinoplanes rectilineatus TaxID=113571 RepID=UPI001B8098A0